MHQLIHAWLMSLMVFLSPPERINPITQFPGWAETPVERMTRYESIAEDMEAVLYDPAVKVPYGGRLGRSNSAALMLSIAYMESGFVADVDKGPCYRGPGFRMRCDGGMAVGMFQARLDAGTTLLSIHGVADKTKADLFADRRLAIRVAVHMVVRSFKAARLLGREAALNVYASGSVARGQAEASKRLSLTRRLLASRPPTWRDDAGPGPGDQGTTASAPSP